MKIFLTGATGYIGGSVAARLLAAGHQLRGLVRSEERAAQLRRTGIEPLLGTLAHAEVLARAAREADAVINAAEANDRSAVEALLPALAGSGKPFIHTSGSGIVGDLAAGEPSERVFDEEAELSPVPMMRSRLEIDSLILAAGKQGIRSVVLRPSLIYGPGLGLRRDSFQVPVLIEQAKASGVPRHVGRGLNLWSNVHVEDLADLYLLALDKAPPGSLYYVENGETAMSDTVTAIGRMLGLRRAPEGWSIEDAVEYCGPRAAIALGSNSRVRAAKARCELSWAPKRSGLLEEIEFGCYRHQHLEAT